MAILISSFCLAGVRLENILNSITDPAQASISLSRVYISFVALNLQNSVKFKLHSIV